MDFNVDLLPAVKTAKAIHELKMKKYQDAFERGEVIDENLKNKINEESIKEYNISTQQWANKVFEKITSFVNKVDMAKQFIKKYPLFYDKNKLFWIWNPESFMYEMCDETDIMILINNNVTINTIDSKERNEILESLKQVGRENMPKKMKESWVQFKDKIIDIETGEEFEASPKYFVTNPIPWELNKDNYELTPNMDRIFEEWVGKDNVKILYEILAYCILPSYPIHRIFCFMGEGMNGKSCFLRLLSKFIGIKNITTTELDTLTTSRFEITRLHKKLVCMMGETDFSEMSKTSIIKKLTGQDLIGFEYKNKNPFEDINYAKLLIATNNLPPTTDKSIGFYRRWMIIDFPNHFSEEKDILNDIPDEEYRILARKSCTILRELLSKRCFSNQGSIEERIKKYEDKSNFFDKFWKDNIIEDVDGRISASAFEKNLEKFCRNNKQRVLSFKDINERLKDRGIESGRFRIEWQENGKLIEKQVRGYFGIKWKWDL